MKKQFKKKSSIKAFLLRHLLHKDICPDWLLLPLMLCQFASMLWLIDPFPPSLSLSIFPHPSTFNYPTIVLLSLLVRLMLNVSTIRCIYLLPLACLPNCQLGMTLPISLLTLTLLLLDVLSTIDYSFYTSNKLSESFNCMKVAHYCAMITAGVVLGMGWGWVGYLVVAGVFALMTVLRGCFALDDQFYNGIFEYQYIAYVLTAIANITKLLDDYSFKPIILLGLAFVLLESKWLATRKPRLGAQKVRPQHMTRELHWVLRYLCGSIYNDQENQMLQDWLLINKDVFPYTFKGKLTVESKSKYFEMIKNFLHSTRDQHNTFEDLLVRAQFSFMICKNIVQTSYLLRLLEQFISKATIVSRILIWRIESDLLEYLDFKWKGWKKSQFDEYLENLEFLELMLKSSCCHKVLWSPLTEGLKTVQKEVLEVVKLRHQTRREYDNLKYRVNQTIANYSLYIYLVERDIDQANKYMKDFIFFSTAQRLYLNSNNIMLHISLQKQSFGNIINCSANIIGKLGYNKRQLYDESISTLVPTFYRAQHTEVMMNMVRNENGQKSSALNFKKRSICETKTKDFLEFTGEWRVLPLTEEITYMGCINVIDNKEKHYWIALNDAGEIIMSRPQMINDFGEQCDGYHIRDVLADTESPERIIERIEKSQPIELNYITTNSAIVLNFKLYVKTKPVDSYGPITILRTEFDTPLHPIIPTNKTLPAQNQIRRFNLGLYTSLQTFFSRKRGLLQRHCSKKWMILQISLVIGLCLMTLAFLYAFIRINEERTAVKYQSMDQCHSILMRYQTIVQMLTMAHYLNIEHKFGVKFKPVDYNSKKRIDTFLDIIRVENYALKDMFDNDRVNEKIFSKAYSVRAYQLIQSLMASLGLVFTQINNTELGMIKLVRDSLHYIFQNEYQLIRHTLKDELDNFSSILYNTGNYFTKWYIALSALILIFGLAASISIMSVERLNATRDNEMQSVIKAISNNDREEFTSSINTFIRKVIISKNHDYMTEQIYRKNDDSVPTRRIGMQNISIRVSAINSQFGLVSHGFESPTNQSYALEASSGCNSFSNTMGLNRKMSPLMPSSSFTEAGLMSSARLNTKQMEQQGDLRKDPMFRTKQLEQIKASQILPQRKLNKPLLIMTIILYISVASVCCYALIMALNKSFYIGAYTTNMILIFNQPVVYYEVVEFFMGSATNNFTNISVFSDTYNQRNIKQVSSTLYDSSVMNYKSFEEFNRLIDKVRYNNICDIEDCGEYATVLKDTTLLTGKLRYSEHMYKTALQYHSIGGTNITQLLSQPIYNSLVFLTFLSTDINRDLFQLMVEGVRGRISSDHITQQRYYQIQTYLLYVLFGIVILPYLAYSFRSWSRSRAILSLIQEDNYQHSVN